VPTTAVYLNSANGGQLGAPVQAADFDGDGHLDMAIAAFTSSTNARSRNGKVWIIFGDSTIGATVDVATYTGRRLAINGAVTDSLLGVEMTAGDLDGDGFADLILGSSHGAHVGEAERAGEVVILYGRPQWGNSVTEMTISNQMGDQRVRFILGERNRLSVGRPTTGDRLGSWLQLHDLDHNGELELVMGMDQSWGVEATKDRTGACVIAWDVEEAFGDGNRVRVGEPSSANMFTVIYGQDAGDMFGATHTAADFDGNGMIDLVVAAGVTRSGLSIGNLGYTGTGGGDGPTNTTSNAGEAYIFWDAVLLRDSRTIDLATTSSDVYTVIYGASSSDYFGEELFAADVTGDTISDLLIGALGVDSGPLSLAGASYVLPGGEKLRSLSSILISSPPSDYGISAFLGTENFGISGDTIEAGDLNMDGIADLMIGAPYGSPEGRYQSGYVTVIYGGQELPVLPEIVYAGLTVDPPLNFGLIYGAESYNSRGDYMAYSSALGDFDRDGVLDFLPNAMQGDGYQNAYVNAGEFYVHSGIDISRHAAAPTNVMRENTLDILGSWNGAQPIFGPVGAYRVRYVFEGTLHEVAVTGTHIGPGDIPSGSHLVDVTTIMDRNGEAEFSIPIPFPGFLGVSWLLQ
jgi:hypothetical protein